MAKMSAASVGGSEFSQGKKYRKIAIGVEYASLFNKPII